jgi:hypothetical protein
VGWQVEGVYGGVVVMCPEGDMATAEIWSRRSGRCCLMEESSGCENGVGAGAVSLRRRRMEIRRIKMMSSSSSSASMVIAEQPVFAVLTRKTIVQTTPVIL